MDSFHFIPRRPVGRPRLGPSNTKRSEDKEYYNNYQNEYYHKHLSKKVKCPFCSRTCSLQKLSRHQQTNLCLRNRVPVPEKRLEIPDVHVDVETT